MVNYLQNEDLVSVGVKLSDCIATDPDVIDYCEKHFGKKITAIVGVDEASIPGENYTPYVFLNALSKNEGATSKMAQYEVYFCIGISSEENDAADNENGTLVITGAQRLSELMTLIQNALNTYKKPNSCNPPDKVEATIFGRVGNSPTHWMGAIAAVWQKELAMGEKFEF